MGLKIGTIFRHGDTWYVVVDLRIVWNFVNKANEAWVTVRKNSDGAANIDLPVSDLPKEEFETAPVLNKET
jgi:hypothetical protein